MKILTVIGARPQFIKAAAVSVALREAGIEEILLHTGQHFDINMSDIFFKELSIPRPDILLDINAGSHGAMTGKMLEAIEGELFKNKPDRVLVYGDTNSTLAGALAAAKIHIPIAHVEAGLRSFNMKMPEEINRTLTDRLSDVLFCPTDTAVSNLMSEGINKTSSIIRTGDVMADTLTFFQNKAIPPAAIRKIDNFILCTCHRPENTDNPQRLENIVNALNTLQKQVDVVIPLHPRTKNSLKKYGLNLNVHTLPPVGYFQMLWMLQNCKLVMTDSGGLQKEAYLMNKFCVTLRDQTEWIELVEHGVNKLSGAKTEEIVMLANSYFGTWASTLEPLYGKGDTAQKIVSNLTNI